MARRPATVGRAGAFKDRTDWQFIVAQSLGSCGVGSDASRRLLVFVRPNYRWKKVAEFESRYGWCRLQVREGRRQGQIEDAVNHIRDHAPRGRIVSNRDDAVSSFLEKEYNHGSH